MKQSHSPYRFLATLLVPGLLGIILPSICRAEASPSLTTIPIYFTHTTEAGKTKAGDAVTAKTMQIVTLPGGRILPKGTELVGHVVDSRSFNFDSTPYAAQQPSILSIHFDKIDGKGTGVPVNISVRALSNANDSYEARVPQGLDESDPVGTMVQVGGDSFSPVGKQVLSQNGDIVGYNRRQGVYARLIANDSGSFHCDGTNVEQSVAIFSASACGMYGFDTVSMPESGTDGSGTFTLESRRHTVKLYAHSAALLQISAEPSQASVANSAE